MPKKWMPPELSYRSQRQAPYGFARFGRDWHITDAVEQEGLGILRQLHVEGLSYPEIADELDRQKIKPKHGKKWQVSSIYKLVQRA